MKCARALFAAALLLGLAARPTPSMAQPHPLWGDLQRGTHGVGFRHLWHVDRTRVWPRSPALDSVQGELGRSLRVDLWYPANCTGAPRMPLMSYVAIKAPGPDYADLVSLTRNWDEYSYRGLAGDSAAFDRLMRTPTAACAEAPAAVGRFPLVVYSAGWFNRAPDNTILAEFLASHGFVVAAVPQLNPGLWTYSFRSDAPSVENQIRDLEAAIGLLASSQMVDRRRIAAMGYSTGGDVALLLQGRNPLVDAVVGLDASWSLGPNNDVIESPFFSPSQHRGPILVARRAAVRNGDGVLDTLAAAPRLLVEIPGGDHGSFSDDPPQRFLLGTGPERAAVTHRLVARVVLQFLRAALGAEPIDGNALVASLTALGATSKFLPARRAPRQNDNAAPAPP